MALDSERLDTMHNDIVRQTFLTEHLALESAGSKIHHGEHRLIGRVAANGIGIGDIEVHLRPFEGDKIAVGISGGKDSLTLLYALAGLRRFYPKKYELCAITVDLGFENFNTSKIARLCEKLEVPYTVVDTEIYNIVFNERKESNPCSLCSKMRKGSLNEAIKKLGCNKVAYGHHKDDIVETMLMSLIYEGRFHTFAPVTEWDRMGLVLIRPLIYVNECDIVGFRNKYDLPVFKNPCEADGNTTREYATKLLNEINESAPGIRERLFHAITEEQPLSKWQKPKA